jgi:hypothetical protein
MSGGKTHLRSTDRRDIVFPNNEIIGDLKRNLSSLYPMPIPPRKYLAMSEIARFGVALYGGAL